MWLLLEKWCRCHVFSSIIDRQPASYSVVMVLLASHATFNQERLFSIHFQYTEME